LLGIAEPFLNLFELGKKPAARFLKRSSLSRNVAICDRLKHNNTILGTFEVLL